LDWLALGDTAEVLATLDRLREVNPDYTSPEGHLLYARSLEMEGCTAEALYEYAALTAYYPGQEARCRYALLLQMTGRIAEAHNLFVEICKAIDYGPRHQYREQRQWYDLAKRALAAAWCPGPGSGDDLCLPQLVDDSAVVAE